MELMSLREQVRTLKVRITNLEKLKQRERLGEETFRDLVEQSHSCVVSSSAVVETENLEVRWHQSEEDPLEGMPSLGNEPISTCTKDTPGGGGTGER